MLVLADVHRVHGIRSAPFGLAAFGARLLGSARVRELSRGLYRHLMRLAGAYLLVRDLALERFHRLRETVDGLLEVAAEVFDDRGLARCDCWRAYPCRCRCWCCCRRGRRRLEGAVVDGRLVLEVELARVAALGYDCEFFVALLVVRLLHVKCLEGSCRHFFHHYAAAGLAEVQRAAGDEALRRFAERVVVHPSEARDDDVVVPTAESNCQETSIAWLREAKRVIIFPHLSSRESSVVQAYRYSLAHNDTCHVTTELSLRLRSTSSSRRLLFFLTKVPHNWNIICKCAFISMNFHWPIFIFFVIIVPLSTYINIIPEISVKMLGRRKYFFFHNCLFSLCFPVLSAHPVFLCYLSIIFLYIYFLIRSHSNRFQLDSKFCSK